MNAVEAAVHLQRAARGAHRVTTAEVERDVEHGVDLSTVVYYQRRDAALYAAAREAYQWARHANAYNGFGVIDNMLSTRSRLVQ